MSLILPFKAIRGSGRGRGRGRGSKQKKSPERGWEGVRIKGSIPDLQRELVQIGSVTDLHTIVITY